MGITETERRLIGDLFRKANGLRRKAHRIPILKAAADRTPMHSQLGRILEEAGIGYVKPAAIIKRLPLGKGTPVTAENVRKLSSAPPMSSHHGGESDRRRGRIPVGELRDSTNPKLSGDEALWMLKWALSQGRRA